MSAQDLDHAVALRDIRQFFELLNNTEQPRLRESAGVCLFDIAGAGIWRLTLKDGKLTASEGQEAASPPTSVLSCNEHDLVRILHRDNHLTFVTAALQGLVAVTGDIPFAMGLISGIVVPMPATEAR